MPNIKQIIEDIDTRAGKVFDLFIQALIILSLISFSVETLPALSDGARTNLRIIEVICVSIFSIEYLTKLIIASDKRAFIFSFFGNTDGLYEAVSKKK